MRARTVASICVVVSAGLGFGVAGSFLYKAAIGLDPSAFPAGDWLQRVGERLIPDLQLSLPGVLLTLGTLLALAGGTFLLVRRALRTGPGADVGRRGFLTGSLGGALAALAALLAGGVATWLRAFRGLGNEGRGWAPVAGEIFGGAVTKTNPTWEEAWRGARVRSYRRLGRTGWNASDISLGSGRIHGEQGERLVREAVDRGVNYIDTAPDYSATGSEQAIGRAIRGRRDQLFLATKFCTPRGHLPPGTPVSAYKAAVEGSLARLGTDRVDLVHVHSCDEIDRLMDPNLHEAFDRLREEGKARFLGFSTHTPNLIQVANRAIESGRFDVMMLAYHHGIWPRIGEVIERARSQRDMGVVAMKTLKGARHHGLAGFRDQANAFSQAAFKWVLANDQVSCLVVSFFEEQHADEYLYASGAALMPRDVAILDRYEQAVRGSYCVPHCGACLESCPEGLPIHDVLRHRMYFEDYGWEKQAMGLYAKLAKDASVCAGCPAPCLGSCPVGLPIASRMREAHQMLTLS